jgi:16S rRNA (cytosine1402-N4)-methyltransferase
MPTVARMTGPPNATPGVPEPEAPTHRPVLLHPLIESLQPRPGQVVVDATLGAGGVTRALLERVRPGGRVLAVDRDPAAVATARAGFGEPPDLIIANGDFANLDSIARAQGIEAADVITFDLGISSTQLDDPARGLSFRFDGPLDMRLDPTSADPTAADIVNEWERQDLAMLIRSYGEERFAGSIAANIVRRRAEHPIESTSELRDIVERSIPRKAWPKRIHPATKTFQALRIQVNHELESLDSGLQAAIRLLRPGGRLGVIAFHSLEDARVKNALHVAATNCVCPPHQPHCTCAHRATLSLLTRKAIRPDDDEIRRNPRARSARLRVAERLPAAPL